jgi:hypothetical protein
MRLMNFFPSYYFSHETTVVDYLNEPFDHKPHASDVNVLSDDNIQEQTDKEMNASPQQASDGGVEEANDEYVHDEEMAERNNEPASDMEMAEDYVEPAHCSNNVPGRCESGATGLNHVVVTHVKGAYCHLTLPDINALHTARYHERPSNPRPSRFTLSDSEDDSANARDSNAAQVQGGIGHCTNRISQQWEIPTDAEEAEYADEGEDDD